MADSDIIVSLYLVIPFISMVEVDFFQNNMPLAIYFSYTSMVVIVPMQQGALKM
jgi:hypothetical protein